LKKRSTMMASLFCLIILTEAFFIELNKRLYSNDGES